MIATWILFLLVPFASCSPMSTLKNNLSNYVEYVSNTTVCEEMEIYKLSIDFHSCFFERKYKDGGKDLDTIIDRILNHAEECVETSKRSCRPDFKGFKIIMSKVISQMKDFSEMYLEEIHKDKEKIKDVNCVENVIKWKTYEECFRNSVVNRPSSEKVFQTAVKDGFSCSNKANNGCSTEAKTSLGRIVGNILGQPYEVEVEELVEPAPPPPKRWYEYITQPFISAWNAIRSFFGF